MRLLLAFTIFFQCKKRERGLDHSTDMKWSPRSFKFDLFILNGKDTTKASSTGLPLETYPRMLLLTEEIMNRELINKVHVGVRQP